MQTLGGGLKQTTECNHLARSVAMCCCHSSSLICLFPGPQMAVVNGTLMAEVAKTSFLIWVHMPDPLVTRAC